MNIYNQNMKYIENNNPSLYASLEEVDGSAMDTILESIQLVDTKEECKALSIRYKSTEYRLNSLYHPLEEAKRWVKQFRFDNLNIVTSIFGIGNGIFAKAILENMKEKDVLCIYEPSIEIFLFVIHHYDLGALLGSKQVYLFIEGVNEGEYHKLLQSKINITNYKSFIPCCHPRYDKIFKESYILFHKKNMETNGFVISNIKTEVYFGKRNIENNLKNLKFIGSSNTLIELKDIIPKNVPAVIVAAGPSVAESIEELKRAKGRSIIIAVDRILDYLLDSGVEPDFVVTVDPRKSVQYFSKREDIKIPLICYTEANYQILERHKGKKIICSQNGFIEELYIQVNKENPFLLSSGSVALIAYSACVELGFERIILVGQDLAYREGHSHVGNMKENNPFNSDVLVEDIYGNLIESRTDWVFYVNRFRDLISVNSSVEVIDAKEKGAKIKGAINMPLKDAVDRYCNKDNDFKEKYETMDITFNKEEQKVIYSFLENNLIILKKIKEEAEKAVGVINQLIKKNQSYGIDEHKIQKLTRKLGKINSYIEKQSIYSLMDYNITATTASQLTDLYQFSGDERANREKTYENSKIIYNAVIETAIYMEPLLEDTINDFKDTIESR